VVGGDHGIIAWVSCVTGSPVSNAHFPKVDLSSGRVDAPDIANDPHSPLVILVL